MNIVLFGKFDIRKDLLIKGMNVLYCVMLYCIILYRDWINVELLCYFFYEII